MKKNAPPPSLEAQLGHRFARPELLRQALTHSSHANEEENSGATAADNEQFEFLGDAVLGFVTSRELFDRYPHYSEGQLSKTRAHLVSARHLVKVARQLGVGAHLHLGKGEERSGGRNKAALLVDGFEALIAALYLDGGLEPARKFIRERVLEPELQRLEKNPQEARVLSDQKSALQEWLQAQGKPQPAYHVVQEEGPEHQKVFTVEVRIRDEAGDGEWVEAASARTKKQAEQMAAQQALTRLQAPRA